MRNVSEIEKYQKVRENSNGNSPNVKSCGKLILRVHKFQKVRENQIEMSQM